MVMEVSNSKRALHSLSLPRRPVAAAKPPQRKLCTELDTFLLAAVQELKSQQPGLPEEVASVLRRHWRPCWQHASDADGAEDQAGDTGGKAATNEESRTAAGDAAAWAVPGLTLTSAHLPQLTRSMQARICASLACVRSVTFRAAALRATSS